MVQKKILFLINDDGSFVHHDFEILSSSVHKVDLLSLQHRPFTASKFLGDLIKIYHADALFSWFGSLQFLPYFFFAKILCKKIYIVSGGFDVAYAPMINHGAFTQNLPRRFLRKILFRFASKVFAVSKFNFNEGLKNARIPAHKLHMVPLGFPPINEVLLSWKERDQQICMIANVDRKSWLNKGLSQFIEIAKLLPQYQFVHIGRISEEIQNQISHLIPQNLKLAGFLDYRGQDFINLLNRSKVIVQLSYYESFCASLIDGAMMGCSPIAWDRAALPETLHGLGQVIPYNDLEMMIKKISEIISIEQNVEVTAEKARLKYPQAERKKQLLELMDL